MLFSFANVLNLCKNFAASTAVIYADEIFGFKAATYIFKILRKSLGICVKNLTDILVLLFADYDYTGEWLNISQSQNERCFCYCNYNLICLTFLWVLSPLEYFYVHFKAIGGSESKKSYWAYLKENL